MGIDAITLELFQLCTTQTMAEIQLFVENAKKLMFKCSRWSKNLGWLFGSRRKSDRITAKKLVRPSAIGKRPLNTRLRIA